MLLARRERRHVMLRLTKTTSAGGQTWRLEGRLTADGVEALHAARCAGNPDALDLTWLVSADPDGLRALAEFASRGVRLESIPPFLAILLDGVS